MINKTDAPTWSDPSQVQKMKSSLCIKTNGVSVNMDTVQEIATNNIIQVEKLLAKKMEMVMLTYQMVHLTPDRCGESQ